MGWQISFDRVHDAVDVTINGHKIEIGRMGYTYHIEDGAKGRGEKYELRGQIGDPDHIRVHGICYKLGISGYKKADMDIWYDLHHRLRMEFYDMEGQECDK